MKTKFQILLLTALKVNSKTKQTQMKWEMLIACFHNQLQLQPALILAIRG